MIYHILYNDLKYDQRVIKEVWSLRQEGKTVKVISTGNSEIAFKVNSYFSFLIKVLWYLKNKNFKVIHAHDWYGLLPGLIICFLRNKPLIYDAHELYYNRKRNLKLKFILFIEKISTYYATKIIITNIYRAKIFYTVHGRMPDCVLGNRYWGENFKKMKSTKSQINILYLGVISENRSLKKWFDSLSNITNIDVHVVGDGPNYHLYKDLYPSIHFYGRKSHDDITSIVSNCQIGLISYKLKGFNNYYCEPNKIGEYASMGLPFISTANYTLEIFSKEYEIGITLEEINASSIKSCVLQIINNYDTYQNRITKYLTNNNWSTESTKLIKLYDSISI